MNVDEESSLPEVIKSVSNAQRTQANEISSQQRQLQIIQEELSKESKKLSKISEEKDSCCRKILDLEIKCSRLGNNCKQLQQGTDLDFVKKIATMASTNVQLLQEKERYTEEKIVNDRLRTNYRLKMKAHEHLCRDQEKTLETHQALEKQKNAIEILKNEREVLEANPESTRLLLEGVCEQNLKEEIQKLEAKNANLKSNIERKLKKIKSSKEEKEKLKQDIVVWNKRNGAQLTRLRKQVLEAQTYNRQWNEQACQLEKNIASLRKQLEE